jgi:MFS transporter, ACS family, tartrate transporter
MAKWLTAEERLWLTQRLTHEAAAHHKVDDKSIWRLFLNRKLLGLAFIYFFLDIPLTAIPVWLPQIVHSFGLSISVAGILTAIPPLLGAAGMVFWSRRSDKMRERTWHLAAAQ